MEVEESAKSRRLLREQNVKGGNTGGNHHTNPAFSEDDSVIVDMFAGQSLQSTGNREADPDTPGNTQPQPGQQNIVGVYAKENQVKGNPTAPHSYHLSQQNHQSQNSTQKSSSRLTSHGSLLEHRVGFRPGQNDSENSNLGVIKQAGNASQKSCWTKDMETLKNDKTSQRHASKDKCVSFAQDDIIEEGIDASLYFHPGSQQRHWSAYKSAIHPRSMSIAVGRQQPPHPSFASRSQSMRLSRQRTSHAHPPPVEPKKLLRQLSFSDSNAKNIRDYGSLRGERLESYPEVKGDVKGKAEAKLSPEAIESVVGLMDELLNRGKIREIALLSQSGGAPVASLPTCWVLPANVASGLVRAVLETTQPLVRLKIDEEVYVCLKHGPARMVGHSGNDDVLVAQKTAHFIVLGLSEEDTPGSCLQEVLELVEILTEKGW